MISDVRSVRVSQCASIFMLIVTATSSISQLQALATGICGIQILKKIGFSYVLAVFSSVQWWLMTVGRQRSASGAPEKKMVAVGC